MYHKRSIILCFCFIPVFGGFLLGNENLDIIKQEVSYSTADSATVDSLIQASWSLKFSDPENAIRIAKSAREKAAEIGYKTGEANALNNIGVVHSIQGDNAQALNYFLQVLTIREEVDDKIGIAKIQNNLGILYKDLGDLEKSLEYHEKSLTTKRALSDIQGVARSLNNIGEIYQAKKEYSTALKYFKESGDIFKTERDTLGMAASYHNIGEVSRFMGETEKALEYLLKSLDLEIEIQNLPGVGESYLNIGVLYYETGNVDQAIDHLKTSIGYFDQVQDLAGHMDAAKELSAIYRDSGNFNRAYYYFNEYSALKDSLMSEQVQQQIRKLELEYEDLQKDQQLAINQKEIESQASLRKAFLGVIILLCILVILMGWVIFDKQRTNKYLEEQKAEIQLARLNAERATELKSQFLSVISHEIRTPLNAVIGLSLLLLDEDPKPEQLEKLNTLKFSAENLLLLLNDVLDYNKVDSGKLTLDNREFDLNQVLKGVESTFSYRAQERGISLKVNRDADAPAYVKGDPVRLTQILNNLMGNALKFTEQGTVALNVSLKSESDDKVEIGFEISDTGIGIPEEKRESIFESFIQASNNINRFGGSGLGLAISKKLIEMYGGTIEVESIIDKGSTFRFNLYFGKSEKAVSEHLSSNEKESTAHSLNKAKILLVEDNRINIFVAKRYLEKWDALVEIANNGEEAVTKAGTTAYDIILMDIQMPVMNGFKASESIRATGNNVPIIAFTASTVTEEREKVFRSGMNDLVPKPFDPEELYKKISRLLAA